MHKMAALTRQQALSEKKPSAQALEKCRHLWANVVLAIGDESSQMDPELLATVSARAYYGRIPRVKWDTTTLTEHPFGDVLMQILLGDFLQLNPVRCHTLVESLIDTAEHQIAGVPEQTNELALNGYTIFRQITENVILFKGTHRFLPNDPLAELLRIMRVPGGEKVPQSLREQILAQIQYGEEDPRASNTYCDFDEHGTPNTKPGFFSTGYYSAINWEQVCRQQQLSAWNAAAITSHPRALWNDASGKPSDASVDGMESLHDAGQLVYYVQAADVPVERALRGRKDVILQACNVPQMTQTGGLMSVLLLFLGMRVKLTKKIMPPELVQEASGEIVRIAFHDEEGFGHSRPRGQRPLCRGSRLGLQLTLLLSLKHCKHALT